MGTRLSWWLRAGSAPLIGACLMVAAGPIRATASAATRSGSGCSVTPTQVALDQTWTVSAFGLPTGSSVNMIINFPDGAQAATAISVDGNGSYTTTGNSDMSAGWGFIAPEQTGTYNYQFVGKIKYPAGTYNTQYGRCSVVVS